MSQPSVRHYFRGINHSVNGFRAVAREEGSDFFLVINSLEPAILLNRDPLFEGTIAI